MLNYFYEIALTESSDVTEQPEGVQAEVETDVQPEGTDVTTEPEVFEIDGEKYTLEQIREWKQSGLRQQDYTKKTQALAREREQYNDALEVYNYLKNNPHLLAKLTDEEVQAIQDKIQDNPFRDYEVRIKSIEIDRELDKIKMVDPDVNEVELLNIASEKGYSIQDAYDIYRGRHINDYLKKHSNKLTDTIKKNAESTRTLITSKPEQSVANFGLSPEEMMMADKLDMSYEEYAKWK